VRHPRQRPTDRGERAGSDERDPPVSDPQREEGGGAARAAPAWAVREWVGLRAEFRPLAAEFFFLFLCSFCFMFEFV